jgi:hypothetical protein
VPELAFGHGAAAADSTPGPIQNAQSINDAATAPAVRRASAAFMIPPDLKNILPLATRNVG